MHWTHKFVALTVFLVLLSGLCVEVRAVTIAWSPVGNPGNAADITDGDEYTDGLQTFGAVGYTYRIGTYDITTTQYVEFLNSKDPGGLNALNLYSLNMSNAVTYNFSNPFGSKYGVVPSNGNHPIHDVSWYSAVRFANWVNNGQGNADTESGSYTLLGGTAVPSNGNGIIRNASARVVLPSEDEWYKAAYYNSSTAFYFLYATSSNARPNASAPTSLANSANYANALHGLSDVGAFTVTTSPYGAFDMNGNAFQWNEGLMFGHLRAFRGGEFDSGESNLRSSYRFAIDPSGSFSGLSFRLAMVPEPSTLALGLIAAFGGYFLARARKLH
jgi:formylglycine-generating enzyme